MKDSYFSSGGAVTWGHRREPGTDGQQRELGDGGGARAGGPDPREGEAPDPEPSGSVRAEGKVLTWEHSSAQALSTKVSIPSARSGGREGVDGAFLA